MSKPPVTSWVIRTKNEAGHIGEVLAILEKQTRQDFETIIVDDSSTDKTLEIVSRYPHIRLIKLKPGEFNFSYALNLGISKALGKYIGILSGHSVPQSQTFYADGLKFFSQNKVAAVTGYYADGVSKISKPAVFLQNMFQRKTEHLCKGMTNTNSLIRKDLWKLYPFDERLIKGCEDYDWALEMLARGYDIIKTPLFSTVYFRVNNKPSYWKMKPIWDRVCKQLDKKKRPSESYTRLKHL